MTGGVIPPGATIGVLGSGQLGRMFAIAARRMGYRVHTLSPDDDTPTGQVADVEVTAAYDDLPALGRFAQAVHVVTLEFENVPAEAIRAVEQYVPVRPGAGALFITQHRIREKQFLQTHGFPTVPFAPAATLAELEAAVATVGTPAVVVSRGLPADDILVKLAKCCTRRPVCDRTRAVTEPVVICCTRVARTVATASMVLPDGPPA